jgi:serine/threonine protein phosphatase 1
MTEKTYSAPEGMRVYAIGDVHGQRTMLADMHEAIMMDLLSGDAPQETHVVYLGDYVDRGPDSKGVIDDLIARRDRGDGVAKTFLLGNHERGMLSFLENGSHAESWLHWGGVQTLHSYGVEQDKEILLPAEIEGAIEALNAVLPDDHRAFLKTLEPYQVIGDYIFAHAGIDPQKSLEQQSLQDLTFIRQPFLSWHKDPQYTPFEKRVVHGHTISKEPMLRPHRIGVDTGAYEDGGKLTCVVLEDESVRFLQV